jgi:hypothetical protein
MAGHKDQFQTKGNATGKELYDNNKDYNTNIFLLQNMRIDEEDPKNEKLRKEVEEQLKVLGVAETTPKTHWGWFRPPLGSMTDHPQFFFIILFYFLKKNFT